MNPQVFGGNFSAETGKKNNNNNQQEKRDENILKSAIKMGRVKGSGEYS